MASISRSLLARGYATAAAVKPPVQLTSLSGTYATSTYLAALKKSEKELDSVAQGLAAMEKKLKEDGKVAQSLNNPTLSEKDRSHLLSTLAPSSSSPILTNLLTVLISNSRLPTLPSILTDFQTLLSAHKNILPVTITTAEPLKEGGAEWKRLEKALRGTNLARGKELRIVNRVNAGVVGGLMVDFGEQTIDLTAGSKVNKFNAALAEGI